VIYIDKQEVMPLFMLLIPALEVTGHAVNEEHEHTCTNDGLSIVLAESWHTNSIAQLHKAGHQSKGIAHIVQTPKLGILNLVLCALRVWDAVLLLGIT